MIGPYGHAVPCPCILSALISAWLFYAGSGAVSIPIIIHLLARRRFKRIRWAAIEFLLLAERQNRRKINLQQLILLVLRCLAIFLLGLMLARPYLSSSGFAGMLGSAANQERIFILDDSFSMGYTTGATTTFDQAKSAIVKLLESVAAGVSPADRITILRTSDPRNPVVSGMILGEAEFLEIKTRIEALQPSSQPARFGDLLVQIADDLANDPDQLNTLLYVVSDFQKKDWLLLGATGSLPASAQAGGSTLADEPPVAPRRSPLEAFKDWPDRERDLSIFLVQANQQDRPNLAVTNLTATQPQVVATIESRLIATVGNFGNQASQSFELSVFLDDANAHGLQSVGVPSIPPGQSADVAFDLTFPDDGFGRIRVEIPGDALSIDDKRTAVWEVQSAIKVLLVNGEPSSPGASGIDDEVALLQTALRPEGEVYSGFQVTVADESEIDGVNLADVHLLMLANVYRMSDETAARIEDFVRHGGGLVVFLGDQVDAELYNDRLWKNGAGLLPCQLGPVLSIPGGQTASSLTGPDVHRGTHPVVKVFSGEQNPLLQNLAFWQYF